MKADPLARFEEVWFRDYEFVSKLGERPLVVCHAAQELRTGRTIIEWQDATSDKVPYRIDDKVLHVYYVANAECCCDLSLGRPMPARILDLNPVFRNITNGRVTPEGKGLVGALRYYGFDTIDPKYKDAMQSRVMRGGPFSGQEREQILKYCLGDTEALKCVLLKALSDFELDIALYQSEFVKVLAVMEHWGVPTDRVILPKMQNPKRWAGVRDAMVPVVDAKYGVYVRQRNGEWSFNLERFEQYLVRVGIVWPRLETGQLNMQRQVFDEMAKSYACLEPLRQLRYTRDKMRKIKLTVGADGRNRTVLWPFKSKTSRTQPKASTWIYSPAVWVRFAIKPEPGMAVAYIDYSSMEFLIAAALSDGHCGPVNNMLDMYRSGDPYLAFAQRVGALPYGVVKDDLNDNQKRIRDVYKTVLLAVQYGMSDKTLAERLKGHGVSAFEAREMLQQHKELFAQYWKWSDDWVQNALQTGVMWTTMGWYCRVGITEFNDRSLRNWPVQSVGADILRVACVIGHRRGVKILAPVHDAVLIEAPIHRIDVDVVLMRECMRLASRAVLGADDRHPFELRTDYQIVKYPDHYTDKRGTAMWNEVCRILLEQDNDHDGG